MDEEDSSIFALLAATAAGDGDGADAGKLAYRELPPQQVWSETVLVDAWTAAMNEFKVSCYHCLDCLACFQSFVDVAYAYLLARSLACLQVYASSSKSAAIPTLDREAQLLASPL